MNYIKQKYEILSTQKPNLFIGSKIRGLLGYALKEEVCINPSYNCKECFSAKECVFYKFYEAQNITHKYRLDFKLNSKKYKFSLFLFGDAQKESATIHQAMLNALKEYKTIESKIREKTALFDKYSKNIKIKFLTPLRIKKQNRFVTKDIELLDILLSIHKRNLELLDKKYERFFIEKSYLTVSKNLYYKELTRKSNKQKTMMNLGGLMGEIVIENISKEVYDILKLGEIIGVGKSTVFGLGKIKIEDMQ